jgi:hypothetical protein
MTERQQVVALIAGIAPHLYLMRYLEHGNQYGRPLGSYPRWERRHS